MPRRSGPRKYDPLTAYLAGLAVDQVTLPLAEVERIIGAPLPRSAAKAGFWGNTPDLAALPPGREAGWWVQRTHLSGDPPTVTFVRQSSGSTA